MQMSFTCRESLELKAARTGTQAEAIVRLASVHVILMSLPNPRPDGRVTWGRVDDWGGGVLRPQLGP